MKQITEIEVLVALGALALGVHLLWIVGKVVASNQERSALMGELIRAPFLTACAIVSVLSTIGMLLWVGTAGRLSSGWSVVSMIVFGLASVIAHDLRIRKGRKIRSISKPPH